jgi:ornithine carbamoyltransferase
MANPKYPLADNAEENFQELFERISFVSVGGKPKNLEGNIQEVAMTAGVDVTIYHPLNRIPTGYLVISKSEYCDVKMTGKSQITLTLVANATATITVLII